MPFDAIFLSAVRQELLPLTGSRVDKIQQPSRDTVLLHLRGRDGGGRLLLSANVNRPRIHLTQASFENPAQPPMFCMLLRKHLTGGRLAEITQPPAERSVEYVRRKAFCLTDHFGDIHSAQEHLNREKASAMTGQLPDVMFSPLLKDCLARC